MKYKLPNKYICWYCNNEHQPSAELNAQIVEWICNKCGKSNFILIDPVHFKIGNRLFLAAQDFIANNEYEIAAILLYSAVDVTLAQGIFELKSWKYISKGQPPPSEDDLVKNLRNKNMANKVEYFQELAGKKIDNFIAELILKKGFKLIFKNVSENALLDEFRKLAKERHKIVHYGKDVNKNIVISSLPYIQKILIILELMIENAFKTDINKSTR